MGQCVFLWSVFRYLNRLASHPILSKDEILKDFLENTAEVRQLQTCKYVIANLGLFLPLSLTSLSPSFSV